MKQPLTSNPSFSSRPAISTIDAAAVNAASTTADILQDGSPQPDRDRPLYAIYRAIYSMIFERKEDLEDSRPLHVHPGSPPATGGRREHPNIIKFAKAPTVRITRISPDPI